MNFKLELTVNRSQVDVWKVFTNHKNTNQWQTSLSKVELIDGVAGQQGAVSKLTYEEGERQFSLIEKVVDRNEPNQFDVLYENEFTDNPMKNTFVAQGEDQTLWIVDAQFKFKTILMKIVGPFMKKNFITRTQRDMERFKKFMESPQAV